MLFFFDAWRPTTDDLLDGSCARLSERRVIAWPLATGHRPLFRGFEYEKGIWWMPWRQEAMKDVARCENPGGAASRL